MTTKQGVLSGGRSIRYPILAIAWVPSFVLLLVGLGVTGVLAYQGRQIRSSTDQFAKTAPAAAGFQNSLFAERSLAILQVADPNSTAGPDMLAARGAVDATAAALLKRMDTLVIDHPGQYGPLDRQLRAFVAGLPAQRQRIDAHQLNRTAVTQYYSTMTSNVATSLNQDARAETVATGAVEQTVSVTLVRATDDFQVADAFALSSLTGAPLSSGEYALFAQRLGAFRSRITEIVPLLRPNERAQLNALIAGPAWKALDLAHDQVLLVGPATSPNRDAAATVRPSVTLDVRTWTQDGAAVVGGLTAVNIQHAQYASGLSGDEGDTQVRRSLLIGSLLVLLAIGVFMATTWASNRLVRRLRRLRQATLSLANQQLPSIVSRLRDGHPVDLAAELPPLDFGSDEIGEVAEAFEQAQRTAVTAAAREAETRAGLRTVFLDIAHRSQAIVYRQLQVLDQAERQQEDPDQLSLLFQLDHLATRSRRNAENLIILGGEQAGRQWRNPVPLIEIVRSAISEAEDYVRVVLGAVPRISVAGSIVGDLIHLIAELVDNATSFSPPMSRVDVRGNLVGRGLVLEIEDQGLGIEPDQLDELNRLLHEPPDFQMMALADEPRLGLFVVGQLAARHGIRVTLTPSPAYGGTRVVVLVPAAVLVDATEERRVLDQRAMEQRAVEQRAARAAAIEPPALGPVEPAAPAAPAAPFESPPTAPAPWEGTVVHSTSSPYDTGGVPTFPYDTGGIPTFRYDTGPIGTAPYATGPYTTGPTPVVPPPPPTPAPPIVLPSAPAADRPAEQPVADPSPVAPEPVPSPPVGVRLFEAAPVEARSGRGFDALLGNRPEPPPEARPESLFGETPPEPPTGRPIDGPIEPPADRTIDLRDDARPALPRRTRQTHLSPRLREIPVALEDEAPAADLPDAEQARRRMSALQRGTMRGRATDPEAPR